MAHAILLAGTIATTLGNGLVLVHPQDLPAIARLMRSPAAHLLGSAVYKRIVDALYERPLFTAAGMDAGFAYGRCSAAEVWALASAYGARDWQGGRARSKV